MNQWLIGLAEEAGRMALGFRRNGFELMTKPDGTPVTNADIAIDSYLHEQISARFPDDCILSEESKDDPERLSASRVWIADPIDGTAHFAGARDGFGTLIALSVDGVATECAANFPAQGITLYAKLGEGAFVNGRPVTVSDTAIPDAKIATHAPRFISFHSAPVQYGNNAVAIFKVITGEIEGCIATTSATTGEHDYAWASCAVEAAGGKLTDAAGRPLRYNKPVRKMPPVIVCSNGLVHERLLEQVAGLMSS